ncbi:MAG: hypothetical protein ABI647_26065 [Gemmatimonadota bacterium]
MAPPSPARGGLPAARLSLGSCTKEIEPMLPPAALIGMALVGLSGGLCLAFAATRRALDRYRSPENPRPRLIRPHNMLAELRFDTYRVGARPLVVTLRRLYLGLMATGPFGAYLFFSSGW